MEPQTRSRIRTYLILGGVIILVGIIGSQVYKYFNSFQTLTVTYNSEVSGVGLYHGVVQNGNPRVTGNQLQTISSGETYKLKKGLYILRPTGSKIAIDDIPVTVDATPVQKAINPDYSDTYLETLLRDEEADIKAAILASNPKIGSLYVINPGALYKHGEWYGTTLSYKGTETLSRDTLRVIVHNVNGTWQVVTNPPQITLSATESPGVPQDILKAVNAIDLGPPEIAK